MHKVDSNDKKNKIADYITNHWKRQISRPN